MHHEIGRKRERHGNGQARRQRVARVREFVGRAAGGGPDVDVIRTLDALRQRRRQRRFVGSAGNQLPDVVDRTELIGGARAVGVGTEPDVVVPVGGAGKADAVVGDGPVDGDRLAAHGIAADSHRRRRKVGVGFRHYSQRLRYDVAGGLAVLPYRVAVIGDDEQLPARTEAERELRTKRPVVAGARLQAAGLGVLGQDDVVAGSQDTAGGVHQCVGPGRSAADAVAVVGDGVGDVDVGRVADDLRRRDDVADSQDFVAVLGNGDVERGCVIGCRAVFVDAVAGVADDDQLVIAGIGYRNLEVQLARHRGARRQPGVAHGSQQQGVAVDYAVL